jgi:outer membrane protein assembly factor BamA
VGRVVGTLCHGLDSKMTKVYLRDSPKAGHFGWKSYPEVCMTTCRYIVRQTPLPAVLLVALIGLSFRPAEATDTQPSSARDVQYLGAEHLSKKELQELTGVRPGDPMNPSRNERGRQAILRKYQDEGRYYASVELDEGGSRFDTRVVYRIVEGPVVRVAEIQFRDNGKVDAERLLAAKRGGVVAGKKFLQHTMAEDVKSLANYYRGLGFASAEVTPEVVCSSDTGRVIVIYHVKEGQK